jgi:hypothetical protein
MNGDFDFDTALYSSMFQRFLGFNFSYQFKNQSCSNYKNDDDNQCEISSKINSRFNQIKSKCLTEFPFWGIRNFQKRISS